MAFWNRKNKSKDPLLKLILDKYHLNLLSIPRENASVGDLYVQDTDVQHLSSPGSITNFLEPKFEVPPLKTGETLSDISGVTSSNESGKVGLDLLEGFLNALGSAGLGSKIRGNYEKDSEQSIRFTFTNATRDYVDTALFGSALGGGYKFNTKNALYEDGRRYFVVTGVARSPSISIVSEGDQKQVMNIDVEVKQLVKASGGISIETSGSGQITFKGDKSLAFGVELFELAYNIDKQKFSMSTINEVMGLRKANMPEVAHTQVNKSEEGNAFVT
jgi:hypothetical protein